MIEITDKQYKPEIEEISEYIGSPLFMTFFHELEEKFQTLYSVEYSGDQILLGWNIKFSKSGRALCRLYPNHGFFKLLIVVGRKEKERVEACLSQMTDVMQDIYQDTKEGMGQRWLLIDVEDKDDIYRDVMTLIQIRRESR